MGIDFIGQMLTGLEELKISRSFASLNCFEGSLKIR